MTSENVWQLVGKKQNSTLLSDLTSKFSAYHTTAATDSQGKTSTHFVCEVCQDVACISRLQLQVRPIWIKQYFYITSLQGRVAHTNTLHAKIKSSIFMFRSSSFIFLILRPGSFIDIQNPFVNVQILAHWLLSFTGTRQKTDIVFPLDYWPHVLSLGLSDFQEHQAGRKHREAWQSLIGGIAPPPGLQAPLRKQKPQKIYTCRLCEKDCNGPAQLTLHTLGRVHAQRVADLRPKQPPADLRNSLVWRCFLCNICCTCQTNLQVPFSTRLMFTL